MEVIDTDKPTSFQRNFVCEGSRADFYETEFCLKFTSGGKLGRLPEHKYLQATYML